MGNDSCFTNDYMFPMSQLSQLVVHHADEKPELAQETSKAGSIFRGGSTVALRGGRGNRWCADEGHRVLCNRPWIKGWEKFYTWTAMAGSLSGEAEPGSGVLMKATQFVATAHGSRAGRSSMLTLCLHAESYTAVAAPGALAS